MRPGPHIMKALGSSAWLMVERVTTLLLSFVVAVFVARYLGPAQFGSLNYATAFIALIAIIPYLGFGGVVVQQLVSDRNAHGEILGTVIGLKGAAALVAFVLANAIAAIAVGGSTERLLIFLISFSMLFDVGTAARMTFEARTDLRGVALAASFAGIVGAIARFVAVVLSAPLWVFALLVSIQSALTTAGYVILLRRSASRGLRLRFSSNRAKDLLAQSWPLIISSAAAIFYLKIDQFMLGQMRGMAAVGTYAVAARLSEVWYFIPIAVAQSIFPRLVELKASNAAKYERRFRDALRYMFWAAVALALTVSVAAPLLIVTFFGEAYREAAIILAIHVWACPAVFMGKVAEKWFVTEDLLKFLISRQIIAAAVNVALNLVLIPLYGGVGAAIATLISYTLAYYFSCFMSHRTQRAGIWMTEAIYWPVALLVKRARTA